MDKNEVTTGIYQDIEKVSIWLELMKLELSKRQFSHDRSKFGVDELEVYKEYTPKLEQVNYNSKEYHEYLKEIKKGIQHHYQHNKHHPQFYENGVMGMTLIDLLEMTCDWKVDADSKGVSLYEFIISNKERFNIPEPLVQILKNTASNLEGLDNPFINLNTQANL